MTPVPRHASIADICYLTDSAFDVVNKRSRRLGLRPPFTLDGANALCVALTGCTLFDLAEKSDFKDSNFTGSNSNLEVNPATRYASIADICHLTEKTFDVVNKRSRKLGLRPPFTLGRANTLCINLTGRTVFDLSQNMNMPGLDLSESACSSSVSIDYVRLPKVSSGDGSCRLYEWLVGDSWQVEEGQPIAKVLRQDIGSIEVIFSPSSGTIKFEALPLETVVYGQVIAKIQLPPKDHDSRADKSSRSVSLPSDGSPPVAIQSSSSEHYLYLPNSFFGSGPFLLRRWLVDHDQDVQAGQPLAKIWRFDHQTDVVLTARDSGVVRHIKDEGSIIQVGDQFGIISIKKHNFNAVSSSDEKSLAILPDKQTTSEALRVGALSAASGSIPQFQPSVACEPIGFPPAESLDQDFEYALSNHRISFQSFYNDVDAVVSSKINDDVISLPCFDEALYCALVREMHRYSLAEIADNKMDLANKNAGLGAMVGSLLGLISGNIFAPFLGHSYGKNISDRGKRVEEFLPDPNLLFYQDENSYLSWSKAQVSAPRLRRIMFDRRVKADGNVFFRLVPAIVTADSVFPIQLFKVDSSTYFYRPFSAGIDRNQPHYDSVKIQKRYFHLRGEGVVSETDMKACISGRDVEEYESKIFRFQGSSLDYFYLDFKTSPGSVF